MLTNLHIAKFPAALMLAVISSALALATPIRSSAAPIEYLEYDLTPYFNSIRGSEPALEYWRPNLAVESPYSGLFDYAPGAIVHASPMVEGYVPYLGYDLTRYY